MPEYLAPGVYVEEVSFRAKSIEGLSTTTTGFVGPTRYGPVNLPLDVVTSIGEFERAYGDRQQMQFAGPLTMQNYMWHAVRSFFEEGGTRLYISRVFTPLLSPGSADQPDGRARATITGTGTSSVDVLARFPGAAGNLHVRITLNLGESLLGQDRDPNPGNPPTPRARGLLENDIVVLRQHTSPLSSPTTATFATAHAFVDTTTGEHSWRFTPASGPDLLLAGMHPDPNPLFSDHIQVITVTVTVFPLDPNLSSLVYSGMALDPAHRLNGLPDSVSNQLGQQLSSLDAARTVPIVFNVNGPDNGLALLNTLANAALLASLVDPDSTDSDRSLNLVLSGGNDGERPGADAYEGAVDVVTMAKTGLKQFEDIDEISIVAAPGSTFLYQGAFRDEASTIINLLIAHAEYMHYRIAVLDSGNDQAIADVRAQRSKIDSSYAALYYPWITILDPVTRQEIQIPPSGSVAGIYARNDITRAVYKAPANEVVTLAIGFEKILNKAQQDILNPLGVNCFRFFEGRGYRLWGGRTVSSDPEWRYVNLRRYFAYLEHSIDKGTQWAVFEPNGEALWANVRRTISDFLLNEFQNGALLGDKPEKAYFVRCDRSTMTQNDLDNGRLVCLIGVAALRPAEYVIFRIGQWTADRTN